MTQPQTATTIERDLPCVHCGYNLRSLEEGALCPECGQAVGESLRGYWLADADVRWVRRLRSGMGVLVVLNCCGIGLHLSSLLLSGLFLTRAIPPLMYLWAVSFIYYFPLLGVRCIALLGWWRLTSPQTLPSGTKKYSALAVPLRVAICVMIPLTLVPIGYFLLLMWTHIAISSWLAAVRELGIWAQLCVGSVISWWACTYLRPLAARLGDKILARQYTLLRWAVIPLALLYAVVHVAQQSGYWPATSSLWTRIGANIAADAPWICVDMWDAVVAVIFWNRLSALTRRAPLAAPVSGATA